MLQNICVIVPSLNPDDKFIQVINSLRDKGFKNIIVVDDGSHESYKHYFDIVRQYKECTILVHHKNLGKGRALKTAFNYFLNTYPNHIGVITVDADNQHHIDDIDKCISALYANPDCLILGVRNFDEIQVPFRSRVGNKVTRSIFKTLCGIEVSDTQTGLRAISSKNVYEFLDLDGERYEFETNMLIETKKKDIKIKEVGIKTVYIDENRSSHFNPLRDSLKIYMLILKFLSASISSTIIDMLLFILFIRTFSFMDTQSKIFFSTVCARILSSLFNYNINKNIVFDNKKNLRSTIYKYYLLCLIQMMASFVGVYSLSITFKFLSEIVLKIVVDFVLFIISFQIQREWVFKKHS